MKLVVPSLIVEENDSFNNDILNRKAFGEALRNIVQKTDGEMVISLDGKWGEGKTTFVKMWQGLLLESKIPNIYIDAFANDYIDDPFITIASAVNGYIEKNIKEDNKEEKINELKEKTKKVGGKLLTWSAKLAVKAATLGVIKEAELEELQGIKGDLAKATSTIIGDIIEDKLESHSKDILLIDSFRDSLSELPSQLQNNEDGNPLVIIIDELDRCKPTFAVEILEKIKHLFSVENIVFVLVMHKQQLEEAVRCIYGQNIDAHTYLQKFINIETAIPKNIKSSPNDDLVKYSRRLLELHELETWGDNSNIIDCIEPLANHFNLSLRQLEKVYTNIAILYASSSQNQLRPVPITIFLSIIKVVHPQTFNNILSRKVSYHKMVKELHLEIENDEQRKLSWLMRWVKFGLLTESEYDALEEGDPVKDFGQDILWRYNVEREDLVYLFAQDLNMFTVNQ